MTTSASEPRPGRAEKKAAQRRTILAAAKTVFFRDGFMQANLDEVAQIAGVAKGTLYRYFDSKADLYVAVLVQDGEVFQQRMREAARADLPAREQIREVGRFYYEHWSRNREYFQIFWAVDNQGVIGELPASVEGEVVKLWESCLQILAGVVQRGVANGDFAPCDAWEVANILWTVANGLIQADQVAARRRLRGKELPQVFDDTVELLLAGLANGNGVVVSS